MDYLKSLISQVLSKFNYSVRNTQKLAHVELNANKYQLLSWLKNSPLTANVSISRAMELINASQAQLGQDILALSTLGIEPKGYFVEFGATNGITHSNTYLLEKEFGWRGILCEPAIVWQEDLKKNREANIDLRCVFSSTGEQVSFSEVETGALSTITSFRNLDGHRKSRKRQRTYTVETVSLNDLLKTHNAPNYIDLLSVDTEGSEYSIFNSLSFDQFRFGVICVEHNYTANREAIRLLLEKNGYTRVFEELSLFDDWYFGPEVLQRLNGEIEKIR